MNRFFVDKSQIDGNRISIVGEDVKHIKDVLRLKPHERIELVCDGKCYICEILDIKPNNISVEIKDTYNGKNEPPISISLFQGIAKGNKMDFIIQKCTEVGVKDIYPVVTKRTVVKINDIKREKNKIERWNSIAKEAAKQSKRDSIPRVREIISFKEMLDILGKEKNIIVPYEMENVVGLKEVLKSIEGDKINIIIGPEGGFEEDEIDMLKDIGGQVVTLGPRILRTETAGIITIAITLYELGDLGVIL